MASLTLEFSEDAGKSKWWHTLCPCHNNAPSIYSKILWSNVSLEEAKIIDSFSNRGERCSTQPYAWSLETNWKTATVHAESERSRLAQCCKLSLVLRATLTRAFLPCCTGCLSSPPSSSSTAEAAQGHERLEAKWRPPVYPPWKPSHALSSTWGIWWKPFVSTPLNYQPEEEPLMLSSDNGSQQPADYSAH